MNNTNNSSSSNRPYSRYRTYIEPIVSDPIVTGYFTLVATVFLVAFFIFFALSPTITTIVGLFHKIDDQKKLISTMDSKINSLIQAQESYTNIEPYLPLIAGAVPQKPTPEVLITDTLRLAKQSQVSISAFQFDPVYLSGVSPDLKNAVSVAPASAQSSDSDPIASLKLPLVRFKVTVTGSEADIRNFMGRMQNLPRIVSLSAISMTTSSGNSQTPSGSLSADINCVAYYQLKQ